MSQQQITKTREPINHEVLIETETTFRIELTANKLTEKLFFGFGILVVT